MKIITFCVAKGGSMKTTSCQVIAELLGKSGKKVLCIDTDPQGNLTTVSGIDLLSVQDHNLYTLLKGYSKLDDCIVKSKYYDVLPSSLLMASADTEFNQQGREYFLKEKIEGINYDYVLIDCPPSLSLITIQALTASNSVIIPTEPSYLAMVGFNQLFTTISTVRKYSNKELDILGILVAKYSERTNLNKVILESLEEMASSFDTKVFNTKIRETIKVREAQSQQVPLIEWAHNCSAVQDYSTLIEELTL